MCNMGHTGILIDELLRFKHRTLLSDVCGDHWCPQTLVEICRNTSICCGFRAVAAREKYPSYWSDTKEKVSLLEK